jgi:hypothetical protein
VTTTTRFAATVARILLHRAFAWGARAAGLLALLAVSRAAFGGSDKLWAFGRMVQSRYTAMAILSGTLRLRHGLQHAEFDEQIYNGATYTNWGFGVPLLQAPFHAWAWRHVASFPARFFPDRAIYFAYFAAMVPLLWAAFDRLVAMHARPGTLTAKRHLISWAATLLVLSSSLYPLMSCRFIVYEETICYFALFELLALAAYLFAVGTWRPSAVAALGAAAGAALVVRGTGAVYAAAWALIVLFESPRKMRALGVFAAAFAPFFALWACLNIVKTGAPFNLGYANSIPTMDFHTPIERFGSHCPDTAGHIWESWWRLLGAVFVQVPSETSPWMEKCHFDFERRPPDTSPYANDAFLGPVVLVVLAGILLSHLQRRERRLSVYVPYAALAAILAAFTMRGQGMVWRYAGDLWPLVVLVCVQYVRSVPPRIAARWLGLRMAGLLVLASGFVWKRQVAPAVSTIETLEPDYVARMWNDFQVSLSAVDDSLPSRFTCGERLHWPLHNGEGWASSWAPGCSVDTFTNLYLGVPRGPGPRRTIRLEVQGASSPTVRLYVNGRYRTARLHGGMYTADVDIPGDALVSPIVVVTVEWARGLEPPTLQLMSVEIV